MFRSVYNVTPRVTGVIRWTTPHGVRREHDSKRRGRHALSLSRLPLHCCKNLGQVSSCSQAPHLNGYLNGVSSTSFELASAWTPPCCWQSSVWLRAKDINTCMQINHTHNKEGIQLVSTTRNTSYDLYARICEQVNTAKMKGILVAFALNVSCMQQSCVIL